MRSWNRRHGQQCRREVNQRPLQVTTVIGAAIMRITNSTGRAGRCAAIALVTLGSAVIIAAVIINTLAEQRRAILPAPVKP